MLFLTHPILMVAQAQLQANNNKLLINNKGKADSVFLDMAGFKKLNFPKSKKNFGKNQWT